jgi:hypothetical protein
VLRIIGQEGYKIIPMVESTVTIQLPETAFRKLQRAAELTYRSIDEVLVRTIDAALVAPPNLPSHLANELAAMLLLSDEALWAAMQPSFSPTEQERLCQLNHAGGERDLAQAELIEQEALLIAYHRSVLRRAQAMAILKQRGHSIPFQSSL